REGGTGAARDRRKAVADRDRGDREAWEAAGGIPVRRLGILISGRGANFEAIADRVASGAVDAVIAVGFWNRADARGLETARERGLNAACVPSKGLDREVYDRSLIAELQRNGVELVCLAGFMRLLSSAFVRAFEGRILNIHPSLLPAFPGL